MQGDLVIVRAFGGIPLVRRVWLETPTTAAVASEEIYQQLKAGRPCPPPIGFPRRDVFVHEEGFEEKWPEQAELWTKLRHYE